VKRLTVLALLAGCSTGERVYPRALPDAIEEGVAYLVRTQRPDGSWGSGCETRGFEIYASVPGSHDAFRVATTALCVMALRDAGEKEAHGRGLEFLVTKGYARRDTGDIIYAVWAHTYALQCLAIEMRHTTDPRVRRMAEWHLDRLIRYETVSGGWFYYDFDAKTQNPSEGTSSFNAAAGLVAIWEAKKSGLAVPPEVVRRALRRLEDQRLPNGAYLYGLYLRYHPRHPVNLPQGSIGRSQACNYALWLWDWPKVGEKQCREGLELLFRHHTFLEIGRKRQWPHEAWYATSGYFYYFGHYYAGLLVEKLGGAGRRDFGERLASRILPHQEPDGSWWDYAMWDYHKPYGTAYALMALVRCRKP
jgi:hypothetical protein